MIKKPVSKEGPLAKIDPALLKIKPMTFPEDIEEGKENFKALVRIRVPLEEIWDEQEGEQSEDEAPAPLAKNTTNTSLTNWSRTILNDTSKMEPEDMEKHPEFSKDTIKIQDIPAGEEKKWREVDVQDQVLLLRPTGD